MTAVPPYRLETTEWEVRYPAQPEPIGTIRLEKREGLRRYVARTFNGDELGAFGHGDDAAVAVWETFLAANRMQHERASHTHGGAERHQGPTGR